MSTLMRRAIGTAFVGTMLLMGAALPAHAAGATQIEGVGSPGQAGVGKCDDAAHTGADYLLAMEGDLDGCVYGFITDAKFQESSGTYHEAADEIFVGTYLGRPGSFRMTENFSAKYDLLTGAELFGRCQHPIVAGSGTGVFSGATGRLDFKDDVDAGLFPYRGHIKLG